MFVTMGKPPLEYLIDFPKEFTRRCSSRYELITQEARIVKHTHELGKLSARCCSCKFELNEIHCN